MALIYRGDLKKSEQQEGFCFPSQSLGLFNNKKSLLTNILCCQRMIYYVFVLLCFRKTMMTCIWNLQLVCWSHFTSTRCSQWWLDHSSCSMYRDRHLSFFPSPQLALLPTVSQGECLHLPSRPLYLLPSMGKCISARVRASFTSRAWWCALTWSSLHIIYLI